MRRTVADSHVCRQLTALFAGLSLAGAVYAAQPDAVVKPPPVKIIRSEFIDDMKVGKDPFFPTRRQPPPVDNGTPVVGTVLKLKLGGISGAKDKRLVIINNKTYGLGEEFEITMENRTYNVRVEEIKESSVIVSVDGGTTQELTLPKSF